MHGLARRVVGSDALADEVTQDVFVDLWKRPERFDPGRGALRTFLLTSAHGKAVDIVRSESARRSREEKTARETVAAGYDLDRYAWDLAVADRVKIAVGSLPGGERQAIELAYFDGRTYREVAEILGEPEGTIKSRIRSGLRRLKSALRRARGGGTVGGYMNHEEVAELSRGVRSRRRGRPGQRRRPAASGRRAIVARLSLRTSTRSPVCWQTAAGMLRQKCGTG